MEVPRTGQENARESSKNSTAAKTVSARDTPV